MNHNIYYRHQRKYLQLEYYQKSKSSLIQQKEIDNLLKTIKNKINPTEYELLNRHFDRLKENKKTEFTTTHKNKIQRLSKGDIKLNTINPKKSSL